MPKAAETLLLIDGSSYIYRAFYAIPELTSPAGEPTNALYGVLNMLKKTAEEVEFTYCAFVADARGKNFRHELSTVYKATRQSMPEKLRTQIPWIKELVGLSGWNVLVVPGVEADDVIATLTKTARAQDLQVVIATGDKDMAQLVDDSVMIINTMSTERLDPAGVKAKYGVSPGQIVDFLTLTGDQADNIRGVDKCGAKTAAKWLEQYHNLDNLLAHQDAVKGKIGDNLRSAAAWLLQSKDLITLRADLDLSEYLPAGLAALTRKPLEAALLLPHFKHFGFKKWYEDTAAKADVNPQLPGLNAGSGIAKGGGSTDSHPVAKPVTPPPATAKEYIGVQTPELFAGLLEKLAAARVVAVDTETTSLDEGKARLVGISFSFAAGNGYYVPLAHSVNADNVQLPVEQVLAGLKPYLENPALSKIGQNLKYDRHVFLNHGINLDGISGDSMLASYVVESHLGHGLDELARRHLHLSTVTYEDLCGKGSKQIGFAAVPVAAATTYAAEDADIALRLETLLRQKMDKEELFLYHELELPVAAILLRMERLGVLLDQEKLTRQSRILSERINTLQNEVYAATGREFNLNSPKQLQQILFTDLHIPTQGLKKTPKGEISTNEEVLAKLAEFYPVPRLILEYRTLTKLKSTYLDKLPLLTDNNGRVHTTYAQAVVNTGRLASNNPNLQNIPVRTSEGRKIREAFVAPAGGVIIAADYSQIELRIMAHLSADPGLIAAFRNNEDIHARTAAEIFHTSPAAVTAKQRRYAKTINFGLIYGMGPYGLARALKISNNEAQTFIDSYFKRYPQVYAYMTDTKKKAEQQGYVRTIWGRKLYLPNLYHDNANIRAAAGRAAINAPMQGSAADLIKMAMIKTQVWLDNNAPAGKMIMQVHDELVLEAPQTIEALLLKNIPQLMTAVASLKVPLVVDVGNGPNWEAAH